MQKPEADDGRQAVRHNSSAFVATYNPYSPKREMGIVFVIKAKKPNALEQNRDRFHSVKGWVENER